MSIDRVYARPVPCPAALSGAWSLAGGLFGFREVDVMQRGGAAQRLPVEAAAALYPDLTPVIERLDVGRPALAGVSFDRPRLMGIVNVTPDSFSDGGRFDSVRAAVDHGVALAEAGADILDIGGESTRPGAQPVAEQQELDRVLPVIEGLRAAGCATPISIDTRKAKVAEQALAAGARIVNDVSAGTFDPDILHIAAKAEGLCLMHALGDPRTMQDNPHYEDVLLDIYDFLEAKVVEAEAAGTPRTRIVVDPGIGFGKTLAHNLALVAGLGLFQGLGCPVLLGVSRKGFIGVVSGQKDAAARVPGSIAAGLLGLAQGAQILRVHDVAETAQAIAVWEAVTAQEGLMSETVDKT